MQEYRVKYWTGQRHIGGPAVYYYMLVEARDENDAGELAKDEYIRRTGRDNFILRDIDPYKRPDGRVLSYGE
jgi:hypothetical protein